MNGAVLSWAVQVMCPITDYDSQSLCGFVKNKIGHTSHIPQGWYFHCNNLWQCSLKQHIGTMIGTSQQLGQCHIFTTYGYESKPWYNIGTPKLLG